MTTPCGLRPIVHSSFSPAHVCRLDACIVILRSVPGVFLNAGPNSQSSLSESTGLCNCEEDSFRIRNEFQILIRIDASEIGSEYGNRPYRSFREKIVPSPRARNCAHAQHVRQRNRHDINDDYTSQCFTCGSGDARSLLRRRSRRPSGMYGLRHVANYDSGCFSCSNVDEGSLLRRRSGRPSGMYGLRCVANYDSGYISCSGVDESRGSGHRSELRAGVHGASDCGRNCCDLMAVGRLSNRSGGQ